MLACVWQARGSGGHGSCGAAHEAPLETDLQPGADRQESRADRPQMAGVSPNPAQSIHNCANASRYHCSVCVRVFVTGVPLL